MSDSAFESQGISAPVADAEHVVWDVFLRVFHWGLAASVTTALVSGFLLDTSWIRLHLAAGIAAVALVIARIVWGFTGTAYARFAQFLPRPRSVIAHLRHDADAVRHIGHNPLGALMVFALLAAVVGLGATGAMTLGGSLKIGPLAASLSADAGLIWGQVHKALGIAILTMIALHLGGVIFESRRSRENLARSMVTGRKERRDADHVAPDQPARTDIATALTAATFVALTVAAVSLSGRQPAAQPTKAVSATYAEECSACHMAYHPATRPARSWQAIMANLGDHFGEDATLPADTRDEITTWLTANASDKVDSKPAALWRGLTGAPRMALPETPQWQRIHKTVDAARFTQPPVYNRSNCAACHADAESGWFSPLAISLPKEQKQ